MGPALNLAKISAGDSEALEELYRFLECRSRRQLKGAQEAERADVVHDAFITAVKQLRKSTEIANVDGYVFRILQRAWFLRINQICSDRFVEMDERSNQADYRTPERQMIEAEASRERRARLQRLAAAIETLPTIGRYILAALFLMGKPSEQIEAELGITRRQITNWKHRSLVRLRALVL
jgi:RNA polymerase sigma factor (sigma-70 family)